MTFFTVSEYIFPEDLEESFLQGELGGKHHTENGVPRHKQRTFSTVNQEQFHYLTDRYTSVNSDRSPVTNKFVFEKAYTRRKRDNYTTTKIDQTVPDSEALYHRDIQSEVNEDYSPFLDELDLEENIEYPDKTMGVVKTDNHVTAEMIEEFKHEYNGTQPKHANTEEIRSNLQTSINIKIRDANINHKGTNENPVANKEILKSNNQSFSSMFTKSDELSETCTKEKHKEVSSPWLTSRKQFDKSK